MKSPKLSAGYVAAERWNQLSAAGFGTDGLQRPRGVSQVHRLSVRPAGRCFSQLTGEEESERLDRMNKAALTNLHRHGRSDCKDAVEDYVWALYELGCFTKNGPVTEISDGLDVLYNWMKGSLVKHCTPAA